jgi:hypothetical protein
MRCGTSDTVFDRAGLAVSTGEAGDPAAARDQPAALVPVCARIFGREPRSPSLPSRGLDR